MVRLDFNADPADPTTFTNDTVQLSDSTGAPVTIDWTRSFYTTGSHELLLLPDQALTPGQYTFTVAGPDAGGPFAQSWSDNFSLDCGNTTAHDTPATSLLLSNDIVPAGIVQVSGTIGDDPYYDFTACDSTLNPGNEVDMYHFQITGSDQYALTAEVSAGRIGSPLNPGLSLFEYVPSDHQHPYHFLAGNDDTLNTTPATDGIPVLLDDSALFVTLTAGDYYLAVSSAGNVPLGIQGLTPGNGTIFDPATSHSGQGGFSTGDYVLGVYVQPRSAPPRVVSTTPAEDQVLTTPPTQLVVQFNEPVNLNQLVYQTGQQTSQYNVNAVEVIGPGGPYYPRLDSFDTATNQATFRMLDGLAPGNYELHLSGPQGLMDFAGNLLVANDFSGDYVVRFSVTGQTRGTNGNPLLWTDAEPNNSLQAPQDLGLLFLHELQNGVTFTRNFAQTPLTGSPDSADYYEFQVPESQDYLFTLNGTNLPSGVQLALTDTDGNPIFASVRSHHTVIEANLNPGTYVLRVGSFGSGDYSQAVYNVHLTILNLQINPQPLTVGPAPALTIRLADPAPPAPTPPAPTPAPPQVDLSNSQGDNSGGSSSNTADNGGSSSGGTGPVGPNPPVTVTSPPTLSADVVACLAAGPVGGVRVSGNTAPLTPTDTVLAQRLDLAAVQQVLQLTILTQPAGINFPAEETTNGTPSAATLPPANTAPIASMAAVEEYLKDIMQSLEQVCDIVFSMGNWLAPSAATPGLSIDMPTDAGAFSEEQGQPGGGPEVESDPE